MRFDAEFERNWPYMARKYLEAGCPYGNDAQGVAWYWAEQTATDPDDVRTLATVAYFQHIGISNRTDPPVP